MRRNPPIRPRCPETGASAVEFVIAIPVLLLLVLGSLQASLLYQARLQLEVATQEAARAGALHGGDVGAMRTALARALTPLYIHGQDPAALAHARAKAETAAQGADITLLNPTQEAFADFRERTRDPEGHWVTAIPSDHLGYRSVQVGQRSGLSIQDATLLKIRVVYHHPLIMPFVDHLFARFGGGAFAQAQGVRDRLLDTFPLSAEATFRMQSPFTHPEALQAVSSLGTPQPGQTPSENAGDGTRENANPGTVPELPEYADEGASCTGDPSIPATEGTNPLLDYNSQQGGSGSSEPFSAASE